MLGDLVVLHWVQQRATKNHHHAYTDAMWSMFLCAHSRPMKHDKSNRKFQNDEQARLAESTTSVTRDFRLWLLPTHWCRHNVLVYESTRCVIAGVNMTCWYPGITVDNNTVFG